MSDTFEFEIDETKITTEFLKGYKLDDKLKPNELKKTTKQKTKPTKDVAKKEKKDENWNKGISFCFTDFYDENIKHGYRKYFEEYKDMIRGIAYGVEKCPTSGKMHMQGYVQMFKQCRFTAIQKMINSKCHFEVMYGSIESNENYCSK